MEQQKFRAALGANIGLYRRRAGLTQAELAQKLNYSDKAVSKWERGDSVPDAYTLVLLARLLGVSTDVLLGTDWPEPERQAEEKPRRRANRGVILMLCSVLVWFVALLAFVLTVKFFPRQSALGFAYAVPINALVLLILLSAWRQFRWNRLLISVMVWGFLLCLCMTAQLCFSINVWLAMLLGIPGQIAVVLWFRLFPKNTPEEDSHG